MLNKKQFSSSGELFSKQLISCTIISNISNTVELCYKGFWYKIIYFGDNQQIFQILTHSLYLYYLSQ